MDALYEESMNEYKEDDFVKANKKFLVLFDERVSEQRQPEFNVCCNEQEKHMIQSYAEEIHNTIKYKQLSFYDIYLTLIFTYYSLHLMEQTEDWLRTYDLVDYMRNQLVKQLYKELTTGNLLDNDGNNISSKIRRAFMGLRGGKRNKRKSNKRKSNKRNKKMNKRKSKRRI